MEDTATIEQPQVDNQPTPQGPGDNKLRALHDAVAKDYDIGSFDDFKKNLQDPTKRQSFYNTVGKDYNLGTYDEFQNKIGIAPAEHQALPTPIQDVRHLQDMANKPVESTTTTLDPTMGGSVTVPDPASVAANKTYKDQFEKAVGEKSQSWGAKPETVKQVLDDFPDEPDEGNLKQFAQTAENNPVQYGRLRDANGIRMAIAQDGPQGVHDANIFNHLQQADNYADLTESVIPLQKQLMEQHGLGQQYMDALKREKSPLINSLDPGLLSKYWAGDDKELGLTPDQYAGLETERLFSPQKAQMDLDMIKHSRNLDESGQANPIDLSKEPYEYRRGLETVLMNLDMQGRNNKARYIMEQKPQVDAQMADLVKSYNDKIATASPAEATQLHQQFNAEPLVQEANKLEQGKDEIAYSAAEDAMRYPLTHADQATRIVKDAMQGGTVGMADLRGIMQGAGESADNTMRWIKNTAINLVGSDGAKAFNNTSNIGHQGLTELAGYEGSGFTGVEQPLNVPREITDGVQTIFNDPKLSDAEKQQKAISYVRDNFDQLTVNPKAGQQNMTGKSVIYQASNTIGQILGIADQSFLMGGVVGDASKLGQMASAFTPMYMSTQNQMYEQALKNGDEHPLLKSNVDATIVSLASLINPDIKVVRGMVGAESALGKTIAGISDETWGKVLSENAPLVDRAMAAAKATGKQLGLANLQYGLIAPVATGLAHKALFNEDPNLLDRVKDGVIQTSISMALPALLHGVWGGMRATEVNPTQKYALVEAGLHPDENIDLIDSRIKAGQISEVAGHDMKMLVKHAGEFMLNQEMTKTDGTPMNEKEVADNLYTNLRLKVLEGKLKTAAEPMKPVIEERIHELNKDISDLHTSEDDKQKADLNQMLHDNLDRIKDKIPTMEQPVKDAIAENRPEDVFKMIADQAQDVTKVDGKEVSTRAQTEEIFGKPLVAKAIELSKQKIKENGKETNDNAQTEGQVEKPGGTGNITVEGAVPSIQEPKINTPDNATTTSEPASGQIEAGQNPGSQEVQEPASSEQAGQQPNNVGNVHPDGQAETPNVNELPFGHLPVGVAHDLQVDRAKAELSVLPPERGEGVTIGESIDRGKELLSDGADVGKIVADFKKDDKVSPDNMSVVRAAYNELAAKTNKAYDQYGQDSPQAKAAFMEERSFYNSAVKPMQNAWHKIGIAQQGAVDLDTGSVTALRRAFSEKSGKELTPKQSEEAKELSGKVKELNGRLEILQKQLDEAFKNKGTKGGIKETGKALADKIRQAKIHRPDMFSSATPASLVWDGAVELTAKTVEAGASIADAISKGIEHIKSSDWYKGLTAEEQKKSENQFSNFHNEQANQKIDLSTYFANKTDNKFTPDEAKAIWDHAKENYIDKGVTDFNSIIGNTSKDIGLTSEQVRRAIAEPKGAKTISDQMYRAMYQRNNAVRRAEQWVKSKDNPGIRKYLGMLPDFFFALKTFGHGTVGMITHSGMNLFRPSAWGTYWPAFFKQFAHAFGDTAKYEKSMADHVNDPMFVTAKRSGLAVDPKETYGEYDKLGKWFGKIGLAGERGFNALKEYRLSEFKREFNNLSTSEKNDPNTLREISKIINHATGTSEIKLPPISNVLFFAPKLEASRWQRLIQEPTKTVSTFVNWNKASDADKIAAKMVAKRSGEMMATYFAGVAANSAILTLAGSKQKINYTDPTQSDWLKFKVADKTVDVTGGMASTMGFIGKMLSVATEPQAALKGEERSDKEFEDVGKYARGKLSPFAGTAFDFATHKDFSGNVLPPYSDKPKPGKENLSWGNYLLQEQTPIPIAEGIKVVEEGMKEKGMSDADIKLVLSGILIGGVSGGTGAHVSQDYSLEPKQEKGGRPGRGSSRNK